MVPVYCAGWAHRLRNLDIAVKTHGEGTSLMSVLPPALPHALRFFYMDILLAQS